MTQYAVPVLFALLVWWFSTGIVLYLIGRGRKTYLWTLLGAAALMVVALRGLYATRADGSVAGAYIAFACSILVWGFAETSFLTGLVTGPRTALCPPDCRGVMRVLYAIATILYHELALLALGAAVVAVTWDGNNQTGPAAFLILWGMRVSAKLNLYLGVPYLNDELLPMHLRHLRSYFAKRSMNFLFPLSITGATAVTAILIHKAGDPLTGASAAAGLILLATLMALAVLEHWFMVLPVPVEALWSWSLPTRLSVDRRGDRDSQRPARHDRTESGHRREGGSAEVPPQAVLPHIAMTSPWSPP
jgi:putative photosynthetic complex assembly protein 2